MRRYLGMCCIVKDEEPFLEEWLLHHAFLGVERFFIYDNGSKVPVQDVLRPYFFKDFLTVHRVLGKARQIECYDHCLQTYGNQLVWLGVVDMDEFVVPKKTDNLCTMLTPYEGYGAFAANWKVFGTNGHTQRPTGLQLENYTRALASEHPWHLHVKVFVQPRMANKFFNPHIVLLRENITVNERFEKVLGPYAESPQWDVCQINHYYYRSLQDFYLKLKRGMADSSRKHHIPKKVEAPTGDVEDSFALRFAPKILKVMAGLPYR